MKHLYILILALVVGQQSFAQNKNEFDAFKQDIMSQFDTYFENVEITDNGIISLYATGAYNSLSSIRKNTIIEIILYRVSDDFIIVRYQYKSELWKKEMKSGQVKLIDNWDMNSLIQSSNINDSQRTNSHPWFFYLGAGGTYSDAISDVNNLNVSSRLGFFLLKNRWDLALSGTYTGINNDETITFSANVGLMTKVYFPIRKFNISPYIGTGVSYITSLDDTSDDIVDTPVYIGISWIIGHGSLDIGYQYSSNDNNTMVTIGYTFSLWSK